MRLIQTSLASKKLCVTVLYLRSLFCECVVKLGFNTTETSTPALGECRELAVV